jgi:hypothetical protein
MDVQNLLKRVCLEVSPLLSPTTLLDGKIILNMAVITVQTHKIARPVMERIWEAVPQAYHAHRVITAAGLEPMGRHLPQILTTVRPVMVPTWKAVSRLYHAQIVIMMMSTPIIIMMELPEAQHISLWGGVTGAMELISPEDLPVSRAALPHAIRIVVCAQILVVIRHYRAIPYTPLQIVRVPPPWPATVPATMRIR